MEKVKGYRFATHAQVGWWVSQCCEEDLKEITEDNLEEICDDYEWQDEEDFARPWWFVFPTEEEGRRFYAAPVGEFEIIE